MRGAQIDLRGQNAEVGATGVLWADDGPFCRARIDARGRVPIALGSLNEPYRIKPPFHVLQRLRARLAIPRQFSTDWRIKCAALHAFGVLPLGQRFHYFAQKYVTKRIPRSHKSIQDSLPWVLTHIQTFRSHFGDPQYGNYFEFGAGWDLFTNLVLYVCGIEHQLIVDLRPYARKELVNGLIRELRNIEVPGRVHAGLTELGGNFTDSLKNLYGITYIAPCDARALDVPNGTIDLISSTNTLEHIPEQDLRGILRECRRICHGKSTISMIIDYSDHYSHSDPTLTPYNYLCFTDKQWRIRNPQIHYQNRLRHSDYGRLFKEAGLRIVEETSYTPPDATALLDSVEVAERFESYDREDLAKLGGHFVLKTVGD